jgi:hypothetical protein
VPPKQIPDELSRLFKSFQDSFVPQEIGSLNWRLRITSIARGRNAPNNGSAEYILRFKITLSESHDAAGRCPSLESIVIGLVSFNER